ncbi:MAG: hypothetical protein QNJ45_03745 [Ardenticatenaceae bacterium]|nr:hypothetical protein [Ardenticatenaceae bacterium]
MDYTKLLKRGWEIVWNFKFLFLLGILSACGGNSLSGNANVNFSLPSNFSPPSSSPSGAPLGIPQEELDAFGRELEGFFEGGGFDTGAVPEVLATIFAATVAFMCVFFILFLIFFVIRQMAEAGMIKAAYDIENGLKVGFKSAFQDGRQHWLTFIGQILILAIPGFLFSLIIGGFAISIFSGLAAGPPSDATIRNAFGVFIPLMIIGACILIPYQIVVTLIRPIAQRGTVLQGMGAWEGLKHGWQVLRQNVAEMLLLSVLYVALAFVAGIVIGIALVGVAVVTLAPIVISLINGIEFGAFQIIFGSIGFLLIMLISAVLNGVGVSYRSVTFTLAYMHFTGMSGFTNLDSTAKGTA